MPRRPCIQLDGVPHHIVQRVHNREPCFFGEEDYTSYLHWLSEALGVTDSRIAPHVLYQALGETDKRRQTAYRALFRAQLDDAATDGIRLALNQNQPLGNSRYYAKIEKATGVRR